MDGRDGLQETLCREGLDDAPWWNARSGRPPRSTGCRGLYEKFPKLPVTSALRCHGLLNGADIPKTNTGEIAISQHPFSTTSPPISDSFTYVYVADSISPSNGLPSRDVTQPPNTGLCWSAFGAERTSMPICRYRYDAVGCDTEAEKVRDSTAIK